MFTSVRMSILTIKSGDIPPLQIPPIVHVRHLLIVCCVLKRKFWQTTSVLSWFSVLMLRATLESADKAYM